jgi:hypothetical protein
VDGADLVGEDADILLEGGAGYPDMMHALGIPAPAVPHGAPHGAAPADTIERALANAPPLPVVRGGPIYTKPSKVAIKLRLGFFEVWVTGQNGERALYCLPLRRAGADPGSKGLMVANFAAASVGLIDCIAEVGPLRRPTLLVDVLARGEPMGCSAPLAVANALVMGLAPESDGASEPPLLGSPASAALDSAMGRRPAVANLASEGSPVRPTVWHASPVAPPVRRCSRLATAAYVSIVDKALLRQKEKNEGLGGAARRRGELPVEDLIAVALEEGHPLLVEDAQVLARACDVDPDSLDLAPASSSALTASP